jgi:hypothetical protein
MRVFVVVYGSRNKSGLFQLGDGDPRRWVLSRTKVPIVISWEERKTPVVQKRHEQQSHINRSGEPGCWIVHQTTLCRFGIQVVNLLRHLRSPQGGLKEIGHFRSVR